MKKVVLIVVAAFAIGALPAIARSQSGSCSVSPDPDPVGTPYTVSASGLEPGVDYVLHMTEATQSTEQHKLDVILQPDASGNASFTGDYGDARGQWVPGTVKAAIAKSSGRGYNTQGGKVAACSFTVT